MNNKVKEIATATQTKVLFNMNNFEKWMDAYLIEYSRAVIFEFSDVVRERSKEWEGDKQMVPKSTAVDILDHFGL